MARIADIGVFLMIVAVASLAVTSRADEAGTIVRRGYFEEITDSAAGQYSIQRFRMSSDGTRAVFLVNELTTDTRGCFGVRQQLRTILTDGTGEEVVEQGFTYDTGVGNFCAQSLFAMFDISDDGSKIAYLRLTAPTDLQPELMLYEPQLQRKTSLLSQVAYRDFGTGGVRRIDPQIALGYIKLTGDGTELFFINRFGPYGPPGTSGDPGPSGTTLYRVPTDGSGAAVDVFSNMNITDVPGVRADAVSLVAAECYIDVTFDGTFMTLPLGGTGGSKVVLGIIPVDGPATARVLLDALEGSFQGAGLSGDGSRIGYARTGRAAPNTNGIFVMDTAGGSSEVRVAPDNAYWWINPQLSGDGNFVSYNQDQGGGSSPAIRWAQADPTTKVVLVTFPVVMATSPESWISQGGNTILLEGAVLTTHGAHASPANLVRFDWVPVGQMIWPNMPAVTAVRGDESVLLVAQWRNAGIGGYETHAHYYHTATGPNLGNMFTTFFDASGAGPPEIIGFHDWDTVVDDGAFDSLDQVAGDGIYTDGWIVATGYATPGIYTLRAAIPSRDRTAGISDVYVLVLPLATEYDTVDIATGDTDPTTIGATNIIVDFWANLDAGEVRGERFGEMPPGLSGAAGEYWNIRGLTDGRFRVIIRFIYSEAALAAAGLDEAHITLRRSEDSGLTWPYVVSHVDPVANTITTGLSQAAFSMWSISASPTAARRWSLY